MTPRERSRALLLVASESDSRVPTALVFEHARDRHWDVEVRAGSHEVFDLGIVEVVVVVGGKELHALPAPLLDAPAQVFLPLGIARIYGGEGMQAIVVVHVTPAKFPAKLAVSGVGVSVERALEGGHKRLVDALLVHQGHEFLGGRVEFAEGPVAYERVGVYHGLGCGFGVRFKSFDCGLALGVEVGRIVATGLVLAEQLLEVVCDAGFPLGRDVGPFELAHTGCEPRVGAEDQPIRAESVGGHLQDATLAVAARDVEIDVLVVGDVLDAVLRPATARDMGRNQLQVRVLLGEFDHVFGGGLARVPVGLIGGQAMHDVGDDRDVHLHGGLRERQERLVGDVDRRRDEVVFEPDQAVLLDRAPELRYRLVAQPRVHPRPAVEQVGILLDVLGDRAIGLVALRDSVADLADQTELVDTLSVHLATELLGTLGTFLRGGLVCRPEVEVTVDHVVPVVGGGGLKRSGTVGSRFGSVHAGWRVSCPLPRLHAYEGDVLSRRPLLHHPRLPRPPRFRFLRFPRRPLVRLPRPRCLRPPLLLRHRCLPRLRYRPVSDWHYWW